MTQDRDELLRLLDEAAEGPWEAEEAGSTRYVSVVLFRYANGQAGTVAMVKPDEALIGDSDLDRQNATAQLIAQMRNALPALLAQQQAYELRIAALEAGVNRIAFLSTNHGGWFENDPFGSYCELGDIARALLADAPVDKLESLKARPVEAVAAMTPYEHGYASAARGEGGPPIPKGDATWAQRLFNRGWCDARATLNELKG